MGYINIKIKIKRLWIGFIFITECVSAYTQYAYDQKHPLNVHSSKTVDGGSRLSMLLLSVMFWFQLILSKCAWYKIYICTLCLSSLSFTNIESHFLSFSTSFPLNVLRFNVTSLLIWIDDDAEGVAQCACFDYKSKVVSIVYIAFAPAQIKWEYLCVKKTN